MSLQEMKAEENDPKMKKGRPCRSVNCYENRHSPTDLRGALPFGREKSAHKTRAATTEEPNGGVA